VIGTRFVLATLTSAALAGTMVGSAQATSEAPLLSPSSGAVRSSAQANSDPVPGSYIVVLRPKQSATKAVARAKRLGGRVEHTYSSVIPGFAATLTARELSQVRRDPAVKYVQQNRRYRLAGTTQRHLESWGLDRIDQRSRPLNDAYYYNATGSGVTAYVVDTGIEASHPDFGGPVRPGVDYVGSSTGGVDCNGHGTHVAGTLGGSFFGVAKRVSLVPVRVLDCAGGGEQDDILAGLDWIRTHHTGPSVANMSIETTDQDFDVTLNAAVQSLIDSGVTVVAAAGNTDPRGIDACKVSPASARDAITVGASTIADKAASFSNYGTCVDLYAPGEEITSDWPRNSKGIYRIATLDGTSMAAPHVAGAAALFLQTHTGAGPAQVASALAAAASKNKVTGVNTKYPHDLLFAPQPVVVPAGVSGGDRLLSGQSLVRGTRLYSANRAYFLAHRGKDSWLCLYDARTGKVVWSSGHAATWTNLNAAGALSSYDAYGRRAWSTNTAAGASTLVVNGKGYLAISRNRDRKVVWTSPH